MNHFYVKVEIDMNEFENILCITFFIVIPYIVGYIIIINFIFNKLFPKKDVNEYLDSLYDNAHVKIKQDYIIGSAACDMDYFIKSNNE